MNWNEHSDLEGKHAVLGASQYHWLNYKPRELRHKLRPKYAPQIGTLLHNLAAEEYISKGIRMKKKDRADVKEYLIEEGIPKFAISMNLYFDNLYHYVNDAVKYRMDPEVVLFYSESCFGTADAISFQNGYLRIHDLKTGSGRVSIKQLQIYAAIFCLEYNLDPEDIKIELRIYQTDNFVVEKSTPDSIRNVMDTIVLFNRKIEHMGR